MTLEMFMNEPVQAAIIKECSACREKFPMTHEFFYWELMRMRFKSACRKCENKRGKIYRDANKVALKEKVETYNRNNSELVSFQQKRSNAKKAGIEFTLGESESPEEAAWVLKMKNIKNCPDCNVEMVWWQLQSISRNENSGSFDRIDPSKGYHDDNVRLGCNSCNTRKSSSPVVEWVGLLEVRVRLGIIKEVDPILVEYLLKFPVKPL